MVKNAREREEGDNTPSEMQGPLLQGLMDTGATQTAVAKSVTKEMGLRPTGKTRVQTAAGPTEVNTYQVDIILIFGEKPLLLEGMVITEFEAGREDGSPQVLVGLDIIGRGSLTLDFTGHYTFCI